MPYKKLVGELNPEFIGDISFFVCGVGSGTTISGIGKYLKERNPKIQVVAFEPEYAPVVSSLMRGTYPDINYSAELHEPFGVGAAGLPPDKLDVDLSVIDRVEIVTNDAWRDGCNILWLSEQKPVGRSSGAAISVALKLAQEVKNSSVLTCFFDAAWKYSDVYPYLK